MSLLDSEHDHLLALEVIHQAAVNPRRNIGRSSLGELLRMGPRDVDPITGSQYAPYRLGIAGKRLAANSMTRPCIHSRSPTDRRAFSLVELIIVLAIVALLGGIAVPRFSNSIARHRAAAAAKRVAADLRMARHRAVHSSESTTVTFSGSGYVISGARHLDRSTEAYKVDLSANPYDAQILAVDFGGDSEITFDIYGAPDSEGTIVVAAANWQHTITLAPETGKTSVE